MYADAQELIDAGASGKWIELDDEERRVLIKSIAAVNLIRGGKGLSALRHYEREGYVVVTDGAGDPEPHPNDDAPRAASA
jgi:hypothetical protein